MTACNLQGWEIIIWLQERTKYYSESQLIAARYHPTKRYFMQLHTLLWYKGKKSRVQFILIRTSCRSYYIKTTLPSHLLLLFILCSVFSKSLLSSCYSFVHSVCWPLHSFTQAKHTLFCGLYWLKPPFIAFIFQFIDKKNPPQEYIHYGVAQSSWTGCYRLCLTSRCTWKHYGLHRKWRLVSSFHLRPLCFCSLFNL